MSEGMWVTIGLAGQSCFFLRFLVQWIHSEREKRSVVPKTFWYLSLAGAAIVMAYGIFRQDPVIIVGQSTGAIVYIRNLILTRNAETAAVPGPASSTTPPVA